MRGEKYFGYFALAFIIILVLTGVLDAADWGEPLTGTDLFIIVITIWAFVKIEIAEAADHIVKKLKDHDHPYKDPPRY